MSATLRCLPAVLILTLAALPGTRGADPPADRGVDQAYLSGVQDAVRQLASDLESLQDDIILELGARKDRDLYHRTDALLAEVERFRGSVKPGVSRQVLYKGFNDLDRAIRDLLDRVQALGAQQRVLQRAAARIAASEFQVDYALSRGDVSEERGRHVVQRLARSLAIETAELARTASYALASESSSHTVLETDLRMLAAAADKFEKAVQGNYKRDQVRQEFAALAVAWEQAARGLRALPPRENAFFLRRAERVDQVIDRLHQALGIEGKSPRLIIRT